MTPERWQQISRIFKSAISLDSDARQKFVAERCGDDELLRSEVEKLIASHEQASERNFIGGHAAADGAELLSKEVEEHKPTLNKGQQFGSYLVLNRLGAGGMGEVYLARDSRLDRTVALKVLSADVSSDKRRMQRFRQEAKVASSLNQPNILTIFEFGDAGGLTYLATEFIDGETLRDYLRAQHLKLPEILDIVIQILAALDAAHEARIVHRDIKPENVMIRRRDRVVKVLDFGLAKLTEKRSTLATGHNSDLEAATAMKTAPGTLMGTINYMSPEQAQSRAVDERTDIWSTGVMLYEMVTGTMPFGGPTSSHTLVQIIENEPPPLTKSVVGPLPPELQRIIRKAMAKSTDDRYQTAKDMLIDLRNLRRQLDAPASTNDAARRSDKKRVLLLALLAMAIVTAAVFAFNIWRARRARPTVPAASQTTPAAPVPERTLTYSMTVRQVREGKQKIYPVAGEINFELSDEVRLHISSPQAGHLYILNEGPQDSSATTANGTAVSQFIVLFPSPTANKGASLLSAAHELQIPEETWFTFDKEQGVERVWLIFSEDEIPELEVLKKFASPKTRGLVTDPAQNKAIQAFLMTNYKSKPTVDKNDILTTLKTPGKLLVYPLRLLHH